MRLLAYFLMCAETQSIMTKIHRKDRFKLMHIVTITEDDNLMSNFGRAKWRRCIRSSSDCVFFAGPCTGGSPWNHLNKKRQRCHCSQHSYESIVVLGTLGRVFIVSYNMYMRCIQWLCWSYLVDAIIGTMKG